MRCGHRLTHVPRWFLVVLKKARSGAHVHVCAILLLVIFFILTYLVSTFNEGENKHYNGGTFDKTGAAMGAENKSENAANQTFRRTPGIVPVQCDPRAQVSEVLRLPPIKFLPHFKNPCWHEPLDSPLETIYSNNGFAKYSFTYEKWLNKLIDRWMETGKSKLNRTRCLPYFFLAGQPKCGTTDFYNKIVGHPDVVTPPIKESHWWGKNRYGWCLNYTETIPFKDYVDLYDEAAMNIEEVVDDTYVKGNQYHPVITGDASVSTLWSNDDWWKNPENCGQTEPMFTNADHVHLVLPQAKIIVMLREPTARLYSDFLFFQYTSKSQQTFHVEVITAIESLNECILSVGLRACVYNSTIATKSRARLRLGLYQVYLQDWLAVFPRSQIHVVRLEDYSAHPLTTIKQVHAFLQLRSLSDEEHQELLNRPLLNSRRASDKSLGLMLPETKIMLKNFYRPYNVKLAQLLQDDRFLWDDISN